MGTLRISRFTLSCIPFLAAAHASCGGSHDSLGQEEPDASASGGSSSGESSSGGSNSGGTSGTSSGASSGAGSSSGSGGVASSSGGHGGSGDGGADASEDQATIPPGDASGSSSGSNEAGGNTTGASVLEHHNSPTRNGVYVDAALTKTAVPGMHRDMGFNPTIAGDIRAQPLFVDGGASGKDMVLVATVLNWVYAIDPATGMALWSKQLAAPEPGTNLHCGDVNPLGVIGTPVVDWASRTMYLDAMVNPAKHMVYALAIDTGDTVTGWPLDVVATFPNFPSSVQSQRGGLALAAGMVWVPYGGMSGDCGVPGGPFYRGSVLAIPVGNPAGAKLWTTSSIKSGSWAGGGIASDGTSMYVATGNGAGGNTWSGQEAVIRFTAASGAAFGGKAADFFAPTNWSALDGMDGDVGSSNPVVVSLPSSAPSTLVFQIGKPTTAWLLDPANLGGVGGALVSLANATSGPTLTAPVTYTTPQATYVAFKGPCPTGGAVTALKITPGNPPNPPTMAHAWCAQQGGSGSLAVSTTDGLSNFLVWAFGGGRLYAFDGDSGAIVYGGGNGTDGFNGVPLFQTPMIAKGYVYVGTTGGQLVRFH